MLNKIKTNIDTSKPVFLIGGGSSLNDYLPSPEILTNNYIITTNNAYKLFPNALISHFGDFRWWQLHYKSLLEVRKNLPITTVDNIIGNYTNFPVTVFKKYPDKMRGISDNPEYICGTNAGHHIINIAILLGFKNIILLGYDMNNIEKSHWHNEHIWKHDGSRYESVMIPQMERIKKELTNDTKIYNINKNSAIRCFEFCSLEDWI